VLHDFGLPADHLAIAALESPNAAARADVDVVKALRRKFLGAANVIDVVRISAVDHDIAYVELAGQFVERCIHYARGNHEPNSARLAQLLDEIIERR